MRKKLEKIGLARGSAESPDLSQMIAVAAARAVGTSQIRLDLDIPRGLCFPAELTSLAQLIQSLVRSAAANLDGQGEISVTAWAAGESLEIEVADNGPSVGQRARFIPVSAGILGADLIWQDCPQGGAAVTIVVPRVAPKRTAA